MREVSELARCHLVVMVSSRRRRMRVQARLSTESSLSPGEEEETPYLTPAH